MRETKIFQIRGKLGNKIKGMSEQEIYNMLRDYGFYDLTIEEVNEDD